MFARQRQPVSNSSCSPTMVPHQSRALNSDMAQLHPSETKQDRFLVHMRLISSGVGKWAAEISALTQISCLCSWSIVAPAHLWKFVAAKHDWHLDTTFWLQTTKYLFTRHHQWILPKGLAGTRPQLHNTTCETQIAVSFCTFFFPQKHICWHRDRLQNISHACAMRHWVRLHAFATWNCSVTTSVCQITSETLIAVSPYSCQFICVLFSLNLIANAWNKDTFQMKKRECLVALCHPLLHPQLIRKNWAKKNLG